MLDIGLGSQNLTIWTAATATTPGGAPIDLSTSTVHYAFVEPGERPTAPDWKAGTWTDGLAAYALTPATIPLTAGLWDVWRKITTAGGQVVFEARVDQIRVY